MDIEHKLNEFSARLDAIEAHLSAPRQEIDRLTIEDTQTIVEARAIMESNFSSELARLRAGHSVDHS